jgi:hypothetical protein
MARQGDGPLFGELLTADEAGIEAFLDGGITETTTLDYKQDLPTDLAETVAAMANTDGGTVIIGVSENAKTKAPAARPGTGHRDPAGTITNTLRAYLDPIPDVRINVVPRTDGTAFVVVVVQPSTHRVVLHREKGIRIRVGDQTSSPTRTDFERLLRREQSRAEERSKAVGGAVGQLAYWGGPDTPQMAIIAAHRSVPDLDLPVDDESDAALLAAARELLLPQWVLERDPDLTVLKREEPWDQPNHEFVQLKRDGELISRYVCDRPGWEIDPDWAINAMDLVAEIVASLLLPFRLGELDTRLRPDAWGSAVTITGYRGRKLFFGRPGTGLAPSSRTNLPKVMRSALLTEPADAVGLAAQVVNDVSRLHDTAGFTSWAQGLGGRLVSHLDRLAAFEGRLGS